MNPWPVPCLLSERSETARMCAAEPRMPTQAWAWYPISKL